MNGTRRRLPERPGPAGPTVTDGSPISVHNRVIAAYRFGGDSRASYLLHGQKRARALPIWPDFTT